MKIKLFIYAFIELIYYTKRCIFEIKIKNFHSEIPQYELAWNFNCITDAAATDDQ